MNQYQMATNEALRQRMAQMASNNQRLAPVGAYIPPPSFNAIPGVTRAQQQAARAAEDRARRAEMDAQAKAHQYAMELQGQGLASDYNRAAMEANTRANMASGQQFADMQMLREQGAINQVLSREEAAARARLQELAGRQDIAAIQERGQIEQQLAQIQGEQQMQLQQLQGQQQVGLQESENLNRMRLQMMDANTRMNLGEQGAYYDQRMADQNNAAAMQRLMETGRQNTGLAQLQGEQQMGQIGARGDLDWRNLQFQEQGLQDRLDTELTGRMEQIGAANRGAMDQAQLRERGAWDRAKLTGEQSRKRALIEGRNRLDVAGLQGQWGVDQTEAQGQSYQDTARIRGQHDMRLQKTKDATELYGLGYRLDDDQQAQIRALRAKKEHLYTRELDFKKDPHGDRPEWRRKINQIEDKILDIRARPAVIPEVQHRDDFRVNPSSGQQYYFDPSTGGYKPEPSQGTSGSRSRTGAGTGDGMDLLNMAQKMTEQDREAHIIRQEQLDEENREPFDKEAAFSRNLQMVHNAAGSPIPVTPEQQQQQEQQRRQELNTRFGVEFGDILSGEERYSQAALLGKSPGLSGARTIGGHVYTDPSFYETAAPTSPQELVKLVNKERPKDMRRLQAEVAKGVISPEEGQRILNSMADDIQAERHLERGAEQVFKGDYEKFDPRMERILLETRFDSPEEKDWLAETEAKAEAAGKITMPGNTLGDGRGSEWPFQEETKGVSVPDAWKTWKLVLAKYGSNGPPQSAPEYGEFGVATAVLRQAKVVDEKILNRALAPAKSAVQQPFGITKQPDYNPYYYPDGPAGSRGARTIGGHVYTDPSFYEPGTKPIYESYGW